MWNRGLSVDPLTLVLILAQTSITVGNIYPHTFKTYFTVKCNLFYNDRPVERPVISSAVFVVGL